MILFSINQINDSFFTYLFIVSSTASKNYLDMPVKYIYYTVLERFFFCFPGYKTLSPLDDCISIYKYKMKKFKCYDRM